MSLYRGESSTHTLISTHNTWNVRVQAGKRRPTVWNRPNQSSFQISVRTFRLSNQGRKLIIHHILLGIRQLSTYIHAQVCRPIRSRAVNWGRDPRVWGSDWSFPILCSLSDHRGRPIDQYELYQNHYTHEEKSGRSFNSFIESMSREGSVALIKTQWGNSLSPGIRVLLVSHGNLMKWTFLGHSFQTNCNH